MSANKPLKIWLAASIGLNLLFAGSFFWIKSSLRESQFELAALNAEASVRIRERVVNELSKGDPASLAALRASLEQEITEAKKQATAWRRVTND